MPEQQVLVSQQLWARHGDGGQWQAQSSAPPRSGLKRIEAASEDPTTMVLEMEQRGKG